MKAASFAILVVAQLSAATSHAVAQAAFELPPPTGTYAVVERGEEVVYYSADVFAAKIEQTGARYRPYRNAFLADIRQLPERMEELSWLLMRTTADVLAHELDAFRAERPDYLITDSVAPWGQWVAEVLGVPVVTSVSTFAFNRRVIAFAVAHGVRPRSARLLLSRVRHVVKALLLGRRLEKLRSPTLSTCRWARCSTRTNVSTEIVSRRFAARMSG